VLPLVCARSSAGSAAAAVALAVAAAASVAVAELPVPHLIHAAAAAAAAAACDLVLPLAAAAVAAAAAGLAPLERRGVTGLKKLREGRLCCCCRSQWLRCWRWSWCCRRCSQSQPLAWPAQELGAKQGWLEPHIYQVYIWYFGHGNHRIYGVIIRFWPTPVPKKRFWPILVTN